ncbi:MAG: DNA alkylation repair protein [Crocinitomicaceae bacterium]
MHHHLLEKLKTAFEAEENPAHGEKMSAYMKNRFVFLGIPSPARNRIQKAWFADVKASNVNTWELIDALWDNEQREYQYAAIDLLKRVPKRNILKEDLSAIEHLITTKSWWDTVDLIASNYLGAYLQKFPEQKESVIEHWRYHDNMWLNRSCLIFQLKYKEATDFDLLKSLVVQYQDNSEFFIQKAIGWSLRQYSKFNAEAVRDFVEEVGLEGLAKREASKYL